MVWFFERQGATLRLELRNEIASPSFELVVTYPGGDERVERFEEPRGLARRSCVVRAELTGDGWQIVGDA